ALAGALGRRGVRSLVRKRAKIRIYRTTIESQKRGLSRADSSNLVHAYSPWRCFRFMLGLSRDLFVVSRLILNSLSISIGIAGLALCLFFPLWYFFPWMERRPGQAREMNRTGKLGKLLKILAQASLLVRRTTIRVELLQ
ncbi:MAG TPA: hypothetical protein VFO40_00115, partial [Chthoniobacterales bacterium]|nr:hypothetical protein [Chthoniobacterales bacterium]